MTVPYWGRILPIQICALNLAGDVRKRTAVGRGHIGTDEEKLESIMRGRADLVRSTGEDFGYDLRGWHEYLLKTDQPSYSYGPSGEDVVLAVEAAITNPDRLRLVRVLNGQVAISSAWRTSTVVALARGIRDEWAFDRLPILADALQDAGCDSNDVLNHCRDVNATHVRGCWVVDLVLGKE